MSEAYARAGVDTRQADLGVAAIVETLRTIDTGRESLAVPLPGHFASVIRLPGGLLPGVEGSTAGASLGASAAGAGAARGASVAGVSAAASRGASAADASPAGVGIALATDSVGSKVIIAEALRRFDTIGIDCVAMNVNDLICVGARPLALLDYVALERTDPELLRELGKGLAAGASAAGVEIPGGEVCQIPEVLRGHPSPYGFDLVGSAFGVVALDAVIDGARVTPTDAIIGLPSGGVHSNGLTLARRALLEQGGLTLASTPPELHGRTLGETLLEPTVIYVRAVLALLDSGLEVHGLAHITGGGLLNLRRVGRDVGYRLSAPLPSLPIFELVAAAGEVSAAEMWEVFNMGCGFVAIVPASQADAAVALLGTFHPGAAVIGEITADAGVIELPSLGIRAARGSQGLGGT